MSDLLDYAIREKYNSMKINDPLIFVKNAIDQDEFRACSTWLMNRQKHS